MYVYTVYIYIYIYIYTYITSTLRPPPAPDARSQESLARCPVAAVWLSPSGGGRLMTQFSYGTHLKGATCSSRVSKGILGPTQPKKPQGPRHLGIPEGLESKGYPRAKGPESIATHDAITQERLGRRTKATDTESGSK